MFDELAVSASMKRIAIIVDSRTGQTTEIARHISTQLAGQGCWVKLLPVSMLEGGSSVELAIYDGIIVGGPVYNGKFRKQLFCWVRTHARALNHVPSAFFAVSLSQVLGTDKARTRISNLVDRFLQQTGLSPQYKGSFAGAVNYLEYGKFLRWVMKRVCRVAGAPTDTTRNHELTDWAAVAAFSDEFLRLVELATLRSRPATRAIEGDLRVGSLRVWTNESDDLSDDPPGRLKPVSRLS